MCATHLIFLVSNSINSKILKTDVHGLLVPYRFVGGLAGTVMGGPKGVAFPLLETGDALGSAVTPAPLFNFNTNFLALPLTARRYLSLA